MTRTAGAPIGCQRPSRFWGLGCPKIYHEAEDTLVLPFVFGYCRWPAGSSRQGGTDPGFTGTCSTRTRATGCRR
ncbi:hypothetical protein, partial [Thiolapillus sp.]|uniref:hypothetical protein n=1 Tax=Thiolapillus sp. TaxID=2017437 RepID=UPI003AF6991C